VHKECVLHLRWKTSSHREEWDRK